MTGLAINIVGCGYIGKKIATRLATRFTGGQAGQSRNGLNNIQCFVSSEKSKLISERLKLNTLLFDLDKPDLMLDKTTTSSFSRSVVMYLAPPPPVGVTDTRMGNFIRMLETLESPPVKLVLISTTGVYGDCNGDWIDESRPVNPQADRAQRRVNAENLLAAYCKQNNVQYIVFRVPGIYAADKLPLKRISSGEPILRAEDSGYTNRIHALDLAAFCVEALSCEIQSGIYNCCDGNPSTMNDYFKRVADAKKLPRPEEIDFVQAQQTLSQGMLSYLAESKRISNDKLLKNFNTSFVYPDLSAGLADSEVTDAS